MSIAKRLTDAKKLNDGGGRGVELARRELVWAAEELQKSLERIETAWGLDCNLEDVLRDELNKLMG